MCTTTNHYFSCFKKSLKIKYYLFSLQRIPESNKGLKDSREHWNLLFPDCSQRGIRGPPGIRKLTPTHSSTTEHMRGGHPSPCGPGERIRLTSTAAARTNVHLTLPRMITSGERVCLLSQGRCQTGKGTTLSHRPLALHRELSLAVLRDYVSGTAVSNILGRPDCCLLPQSSHCRLGRGRAGGLDPYGNMDCFKDPPGERYSSFQDQEKLGN